MTNLRKELDWHDTADKLSDITPPEFAERMEEVCGKNWRARLAVALNMRRETISEQMHPRDGRRLRVPAAWTVLLEFLESTAESRWPRRYHILRRECDERMPLKERRSKKKAAD